eukprot:CAMPEP_0202875458 /NCGR_PEP_ID=MMETSP1391-20130828/27336_1 /ASSEMBLY_ACC=CAM_ASM_000867 /TAXON_ID=1034604 /ORGANISM="Chlamydomonas leiostraca, Strain SAG 11-49" /LENGTH=199 /DNA_ID=CAMNT_0049557139 /DNA_START=100 /DNA_END=699 /DNA_ORIENTATION=-
MLLGKQPALKLAHGHLKRATFRPAPPVQPPHAVQCCAHVGCPACLDEGLQDVWCLVRHPHWHPDRILLQGQLLLPFHQDAILHDERDAAARDRHLHAPAPAPASSSQAEDGAGQVLPVRLDGVLGVQRERAAVAEHAVQRLARAKAVRGVPPWVVLVPWLACVQVDLAAIEQEVGPVLATAQLLVDVVRLEGPGVLLVL